MRLVFWSCMLGVILVATMGERHRVKKHKKIGYVRGCYYTNWSQWRAVPFLPEHIPSGLCTHIMYAFGRVDANGNVGLVEKNDPELYERVAALKKVNPSVKILISYGGWNMSTSLFTQIAQSVSTRKQFVESALELIQKYNFDGLDLDWEYPQGVASDHVLLSKQIRETFDQVQSGLLLTAAVAAGEEKITSSYDIKAMSSLYDLIFLMSYDFHGTWESSTNLHGQLREPAGSNGRYNTEYAAHIWVQGGMPKSKIVIGIPAFSRGWTLASASANGIGARTVGPSAKTTIDVPGIAAYWEVCGMIAFGGTEKIDAKAVGAYTFMGDQWHGYDNPETVAIKMAWIKKKGYAGAFLWTLDFDDFTGSNCFKGKYPILSAIREGLNGSRPGPKPTLPPTGNTTTTATSHTVKITTTKTIITTKPNTVKTASTRKPTVSKITTTTTTKTTTIITTKAPSPGISCPQQHGIFKHPTYCTKFIICGWNIAHEMNCPAKLFFNEDFSACDYMYNALPGRC